MSSLLKYPGQTAPVKIALIKAGQTCKTYKDIERGRSKVRMGEEEMKREIAGEKKRRKRGIGSPLCREKERGDEIIFCCHYFSLSCA